MQKPNGASNSFQGPKWLPPIAFIAIGLVGYVGFVWLRGNYLDAPRSGKVLDKHEPSPGCGRRRAVPLTLSV